VSRAGDVSDTGALPGPGSTLPPSLPPGAPPPIAFDPEIEPESRLPSDHPAWARDVVSLSLRARELFARLKPVVVRVFAAWEHRVRSILVGGARLSVDLAGCYRID
jgi:hypothetical protein